MRHTCRAHNIKTWTHNNRREENGFVETISFLGCGRDSFTFSNLRAGGSAPGRVLLDFLYVHTTPASARGFLPPHPCMRLPWIWRAGRVEHLSMKNDGWSDDVG